jgi:hypothetical protein
VKTRGISLLELLLTIALLAITMGAVTQAFIAGLGAESHIATAREAKEERYRFEDDLQKLIEGAELSDPNSAFVSPIPATNQKASPNSSPQGAGDQSGSGGGLPAGSASLVFGTWSVAPNIRFVEQTNAAWEDLNSRFGPQGGSTEVALSTIPVGDAGPKRGLFIREDRPAQADPSTGGMERLYSSKVRDIRFEFYDGTTWQTSWDSKNTEKGQLPIAVRVTYLLNTESSPRSFIARLRIAAGGSSS